MGAVGGAGGGMGAGGGVSAAGSGGAGGNGGGSGVGQAAALRQRLMGAAVDGRHLPSTPPRGELYMCMRIGLISVLCDIDVLHGSGGVAIVKGSDDGDGRLIYSH